MTDIYGTELLVGDKVAFGSPNGDQTRAMKVRTGEITGFTSYWKDGPERLAIIRADDTGAFNERESVLWLSR